MLRTLSGRRGPIWLAGFAALLSLRAFGFGFQLDDYWLRSRSVSHGVVSGLHLWTFPPVELADERVLGLATLWFPAVLGGLAKFERKLEELASAAASRPGVTQVVLVNSPFEILNNTVPYLLGMDVHAPSAPRSFHALYAGPSTLELQRIDERTLEIRTREGWGRVPVGRIFCSDRDLPRVGDERHLDQLTVRVLETTSDGLPARVSFRFASAIDDPARTWLVWNKRQPIVWTPPATGASARVAGVSLVTGFELDRP